jgi:hypothetical protein
VFGEALGGIAVTHADVFADKDAVRRDVLQGLYERAWENICSDVASGVYVPKYSDECAYAAMYKACLDYVEIHTKKSSKYDTLKTACQLHVDGEGPFPLSV